MTLTVNLIESIFTYHAPFGDQPQRYERLREKAKELAYLIESSCPESREKLVAFTQLQQCVQMAKAAIAIYEDGNFKPMRLDDMVSAYEGHIPGLTCSACGAQIYETGTRQFNGELRRFTRTVLTRTCPNGHDQAIPLGPT